MITETTSDSGWQQPIVFSATKAADRATIKKMQQAGQISDVHDQIQLAITELFDIEHPGQKDTKTAAQVAKFSLGLGGEDLDNYGHWIYFPWDKRLVHFPPQDDLRRLRTSRNRNLVTAAEQHRLYGATIAILGMSVGSNAVEALVGTGVGGRLILVDMDYLEPSNLNRIRAPYHHLGLHKVDAIARKISEIDPYLEQIHYKDGLNDTILAEVLANTKPDVFVDEMDDVRMKIRLRLAAKAARVPVIQAADDGDGVVISIERFDLVPESPILGGLVPQAVISRLLSDEAIPRAELGMIIGKYFVGFEYTPLRMFESLSEVGKTLPSWPQLGGAAALAGVTLAYAAKRIITGAPINAGRHLITPDDALNPEIHTKAYQDKMAAILAKIGT